MPINRLKFILDPDGDNRPPVGAKIVSCESDLLKGFLDSKQLYVQGVFLCGWASDYASARGIDVTWLTSPIEELLQDCPDLTRDEAILFMNTLVNEDYMRPATVKGLASIKWKNNLWNSNPSVEHAFKWLLWVSSCVFTEYELKVILSVSSQWIDCDIPWIKKCYSADTPTAWKYLLQWLRIDTSTVHDEWPNVPDGEVSEILAKELEKIFLEKMVATDGEFSLNYLTQKVSFSLKQKVSRLCYQFFKHNADKLDRTILDTLKPYLDSNYYENLLEIVPLDPPMSMPSEFSQIKKWFIDQYLPFRIKTSKDISQDHRDTINGIAKDFSDWFLKFYADANSGSKNANDLSWSKTSELCMDKDNITLLVVLDGLSYIDCDYFQKVIADKSNRLSLEEFDLVISPIPTVTKYAKAALLKGVSPKNAIEDKDANSVGVQAKKVNDVISSLNSASNGDVVIWSLVNPDAIYHKGYDVEALRSHVNGWLQGFAQLLVNVLHEVDSCKSVNTIITTDHGRLLSLSLKKHKLQGEYEAHGRVAWGDYDISFDQTGYKIVDDICYLHPGRFGLEKTCAIILTDESFIPLAGSRGYVPYPHGGLFPEEVFIPWMKIARDTGPLSLHLELLGSGIAGKAGEYIFSIINSSNIKLWASRLVFSKEKVFDLGYEILPMKKSSQIVNESNWPTKEAASSLTVILEYYLPNSEIKTQKVDVNLRIDQMYVKSDILGDL